MSTTDQHQLNYIVNHIFLPPKLPQEDDQTPENDRALCAIVYRSVLKYRASLPVNEQVKWDPIVKMQECLCILHDPIVLPKDHLKMFLSRMQPGDVLSLLIRAQNAGVILRRFEDQAVFEAFEVSPTNAVVMGAEGKLLCSYPGPAVAVPAHIFQDAAFCEEFSSFLVQMNVDILDSAATTIKAKSTVVEIRDSAHPKYITDLLTQILLGMGAAADVRRIQKRIADDVMWKSALKPWRRSPLWLVIRVALQTSLYNISGNHTDYKAFMVFMMGKILQIGSEYLLPSDLLFCMRGKLSRRLYKLGAAAPDSVARAVQKSGEDTEKLLQRRWLEIQNAQECSAHWAPETLDPLQDTRLSLSNSASYISGALERTGRQRSSSAFKPDSFRRFYGFDTFDAANSSLLSDAFAANSYTALCDFELAVQEHLDVWVTQNLHSSSASATMAACVTQYSEAALKLYDSDPQSKSLMFLTLFDLWVALDKISVAQCSLLKDYSPEVPRKLLESLLLSRSQPLARAAMIEEYLHRRDAGAIPGRSIFTDEMSSSTFPVRYFASSSTHKSLKLRIERDARGERDAKLTELESKNENYRSLMAESGSLSHKYSTSKRGNKSHDHSCRKCSLEKKASKLRIAPHEWPLPEDEFKAQTVVFELVPPVVFWIWRNTTYQILRDICSSVKSNRANPPIQLGNYASLQKYGQNLKHTSSGSRITLASTTKSFLKSHYKKTSIPSTESAVCLNNGLQFRLYDSVNDAWAATPFENCSIVKSCTLRLSEGPYTGLQYAVDNTSHTTNEVVALQSDCSKELTLHEYFSFAALRSGPRLQWLNISRELRARSLSFHREEVYILMTQAAWQIGPLVDGDREWHAELKEANFAHVLLHELEDLLLSIEANWLEGISVKITVVLARRLLASTFDSAVEAHACAFLRKARQVTFKWVQQLADKLQESKDDATVQEFQRRVCEMAAICRGTFDPDHTASLLVSPDDVCILVHCAILVHDNSPVATSLPPGFKRVLEQDRRLSHLLEAPLHEQIKRSRSGLDRAIAAVWTAYRPGSRWRWLEAPNDHWVMATTAIQTIGQEPQCVQFGLLDGRLLIDGKPLGRLPPNIVNHPTYSRVLGRKVLDIIPADMTGMDYATRNSICDYQLFFGMPVDDSNLVIRTRCGTEVLELIPHQKLNGDLPKLFVTDYTHWLNVSTSEIELRLLDNPWKSAPSNWRIQFSTDGQSNMTQKTRRQPTTLLVDIRSSTFRMLSNSLVQLEHAENTIITCSLDDLSLSIDLPRFRLSFFLNDRKHLESRNWPGMVIDSCQSSGTMFGLSSQLVLRTERRELPQPRRVIIPKGKPQARRDGDHVRINIDTASQSMAKYHEYTIDTDLCRLTCKTLESKLFKIYLHAVSSHCLPDPLTGRTGTQEALHELRSAGCKSFQQLEAAELAILLLIRSLTPKREFYPAHLQVMQTVHWSDLPPSAQHHGFSIVAQTIIDYSEQLQLFAGSFPRESLTTKTNLPASSNYVHLLNRSARRNAIFYPQEFTDPLKLVGADVVHASRDESCGNPDTRVTNISRMVHQWPTRLSTCTQLMEVLKRWGSVSGFDEELSLSYSRHWLGRDLAMAWIPLYRLCHRSIRERDRFGLEFSLAALAYTKADCEILLPTILAFATVPQFRQLSPPLSPHYDLDDGFLPRREKLMQIVLDSAIMFEQSSDADLPAFDWEDETTLGRRRYSSFVARRDSQATECVDQLLRQWPCEVPSPSSPTRDRRPWLFNISSLMVNVKPLFKSWYWNDQLRGHLQKVQNVLDEIYLPDTTPNLPRFKFTVTSCINSRQPSALSVITFDSLLKRDPPKLALNIPVLPTMPRERKKPSHPDFTHRNLKSLLLEFESSPVALHQQYGRDLDSSYRSLDSDFPSTTISKHIPSLKDLTEHHNHSMTYLKATLSSIRKSLLPRPSSIVESTMLMAGQWPCVTMITLLGKLAPTAGVVLTNPWRRVLIELAQGLLVLQRSQRLLYFAFTQNEEDLVKELANEVHCDYAMEYPDWLLIQVESNFSVRPIQLQCAYEMMTPRSEQNTALQLNMGEGKSSVIVPMISAALADGKTLVRVIVLKSLSNQMFRLLVDRLTGLLNRRIFYLPFSRSVMLDADQVQHIQALNEECMREGGVLVAQPEHILSFKLMAIDKTLCSKSSAEHNVAAALVRSQRWLEGHSRDVLDESDEILHVRYQLVYTVGQQRPLEGHPDRWTTMQQVLSLVKRHAICILNDFPLGIEVQEGVPGQFPFIRILHADAGAALVSLVSKDILGGGLHNYSFAILGERVCRAAFGFVTRMNVPDEDLHLLRAKCEGTSLWSGLLLLRGLLAHSILEYVLKARQYRVDYGLDQSRSLLAVPYRAKDVPALRAEFGHPDVVILLTCLSYYYQGLSKDQLDHCFQLLYKLDNPTEEYDTWVFRDNSIPEALRQLSGVNTSDPKQCEECLFPLFHRRQAVVDFYLSQVVFPKQAKEFPEKLATSGWDIAEVKEKLTTGFSGTNDNRYLLPSSIIQDDPIGQLSTNAKVLTYLLQSENNHYLCTNPSGQACSAQRFLELLVGQIPEIRVLLDVGAQMLDLQNQKLAELWLSLVPPDVPAVVFFGDNDELAVLTRDGILESFVSSPFSQQLGKCLVYLDDAHTRGTDLKLPRDYRAAVTLGPKVTKDRLLQGCMRMRKLGHGQSVMFFAPLEVDRRIREYADKSSDKTIETIDILRWAMFMTCMDIKHHIPHWAQQGLDYKNRSEAWGRFCDNPLSINILQSPWLQAEARSLETMYGVSNSASHNSEQIHTAFDIPAIRDRCLKLGVHFLSDPRMEEEQEREVNHEIERERQVQRPPKTQPAKHAIHPDLCTFVETGVVSQLSLAFSSPFTTTADSSPECSFRSPNLLATRDFSTTISGPVSNVNDYLRPVNWIVTSALPYGTLFVILSPYEVNKLLPAIRRSKKVHLHQYSARVTQTMKSFEHLMFYCIPSLPSSWVSPPIDLRNRLNLWAGQLYLEDLETYVRLCNFLGLYTIGTPINIPIQADGFVQPHHRLRIALPYSPFTESPLPFLRELAGMRRKGMGYLSSHLGKILHAKLLTQEDFLR